MFCSFMWLHVYCDHLKFILLWGVDSMLFFKKTILVYQYYSLKGPLFHKWIAIPVFITFTFSYDYFCIFYSIHWSFCFFMCQHHTFNYGGYYFIICSSFLFTYEAFLAILACLFSLKLGFNLIGSRTTLLVFVELCWI